MVHLSEPPVDYVLASAQWDRSLALEAISVAELPPDWNNTMEPQQTRRIGDEWLKRAASAVLRVPSILIREECNYLLNPMHPDFSSIALGEPKPLEYDLRMF